MERRTVNLPLTQCRILKRETDPPAVIGYGAVFYDASQPGTEYSIFDDLVERIMPGAFDRALKAGQDVRALFNHSPDFVLGRTGNGTCKLSVDAVGLRYEITPPDTQCARDLMTSIARGDVCGSSFSFIPVKQNWITQKSGPAVREIRDCDLYDVGPVTFPAYGATSTGIRSVEGVDELRKQFEEHRAKEKARALRCHVDVRARIVRLGL
jgi:HK97 family phage prohead protease